MKLFILCLGFYLASLSLAKAQDSTQTERKDSTALSDTTRIPDSLKTKNSSRDSIAHLDSAAANTSKTAPFKEMEQRNPDTAGTVPQDTIVDIFEEMKKAKQEQDQSMQEDPHNAPTPSTHKDSVIEINAQEPASDDDTTDAKIQDQTKDTSTFRPATTDTTKASEIAENPTAITDPKISPQRTDSLTKQPNANEINHTDTSSSTDQIDSTSGEKAIEKQFDKEEGDGTQTTNHSLDNTTDSATLSSPVRDSIQSLFTLPSTKPTAQQQADDTDSIQKDPSGLTTGTVENQKNSDTTRTDGQTVTTAPENTTQPTDSTRSRQNTALKEIFSDVEQKKANDPTRLSSDSAIASGAAEPTPAADTPDHKTREVDTATEKRLVTGREGLDSTINAKEAPESGTPFTQLFQPYRKFNKNTNIESTTNLTILQQHVNYKTTADFSTQFQRSGQEGQNYLFDVSVVRLNTEVETMGVQLKYDSNTPTDSTSTFAKPLFDIVGKRTFLKVDSTGKIVTLDTSQLGQQVNTVLSGLSLSGGDYAVGSNFGLLLNNENDALKVGQTWQDSIRQGANQRVTTYKVQNLVEDEYIVIISGTVVQSGEITSDGLVFKTHFTGTQKGKMRVDKTTRLIKNKELTLDMKGTVDYQDNELPAAAISKINENVTEQ